MDKRKAYEEKLGAQLEEWSAQLALLKARAGKAAAGAKIEYCTITETLQGKYDEAGGKLQELKTASDEKWEEIKTGAENAWNEVKAAFHAAASKLK